MIEPRPADQQFIFVGGLHRSGTSMLARMLMRHQDASGLTNTGISEDEGQFLQTVYIRDSELGGAGRFAFDPRAQRPACMDADHAASMRNSMLAGWDPYWDTSRRFLVEKTPGNCLNARFLQSVFPGQCSFVLLTRHPIANALATRKWSRTSLFALIEHWLHAHELMRAQLPHLRQVAWIAYENLVADPAGTVSALRAFLGMRPDNQPIEPQRDLNLPYLASWQRQYHDRIAQLPDSIKRGEMQVPSARTRALWKLRAHLRRRLLDSGLDLLSTGREAAAVITHYETRVQKMGYSLIDTGLSPPAARLYGPGCLSSFAPIPGPLPVPGLTGQPVDGHPDPERAIAARAL